ncbi:phage tail tape measure protein [Marivivens sp. LCG002]|uniref:phage tail tape measure protein n=1 Tax=Marivivens sp. LCG002 TaxID=3051171 RepID=UPI002555DC2D|nr:phage tail tape measure protein [Marivivens sp. LCG002]WIV49524.1 phage tail tape measure protein [Marivivens sp. LCG002]
MSTRDDIEALEDRVSDLSKTLDTATGMTSAFSEELTRVQGSLGSVTRDLGKLERGFSSGLKRAVDGLVIDGRSLGDVLTGLGQTMAKTAYDAAMKPVTDHFGGLLASGLNAAVSGLMPFAKGGSFSQGRVMPFAKGGVVSSPVSFPLRGATGLMGEAGPEAIMPLRRGPDGSLGVAAQTGAAPQITINIATPDVAGFQRSKSQIAAQMARALGQGTKNR